MTKKELEKLEELRYKSTLKAIREQEEIKTKVKTVLNVVFEADKEMTLTESVGKVFIVKKLADNTTITLREIPFPFDCLQIK